MRKVKELSNSIKIGYSVYGEGQNVVFLLHGLIGSSLITDEWKRKISESNVRLIALERIGYGLSSQNMLSEVKDWVVIFKELVEKLGVQEADVIGISAGAPYAYALAYAVPDIIRKVYVLSGVPAVYKDDILKLYGNEGETAYKNFLTMPFDAVQEYYMNFMNRYKAISEGDELSMTVLNETLNQKCFGMALESVLQITPWNISFHEIKQEITYYHASNDAMVPYEAVLKMPPMFDHATFVDVQIDANDQDAHMSCADMAFESILSSNYKL